jgi:hypothetical protein
MADVVESHKEKMGNALLEMMGNLSQVIDAVAGYRNRAISLGFSQETAEIMAQELHMHLMSLAFKEAH